MYRAFLHFQKRMFTKWSFSGSASEGSCRPLKKREKKCHYYLSQIRWETRKRETRDTLHLIQIFLKFSRSHKMIIHLNRRNNPSEILLINQSEFKIEQIPSILRFLAPENNSQQYARSTCIRIRMRRVSRTNCTRCGNRISVKHFRLK